MEQNTCAVEDCDGRAVTRGWCKKHYTRWHRHGTTDGPLPSACKIDGCEKRAKVRGWCTAHYGRWMRHGDPEGGRVASREGQTCQVEGCGKPVRSREWCTNHYDRWKRHGDAEAGAPARLRHPVDCKIDNCTERARTRGWCKRHYQAWNRTGDPLGSYTYTKRGAPLEERLNTRIARTDHCWFWLGHVNRDGYGTIDVDGRNQLAHRVSYETYVGPIPDGLVIDHVCRNRACVNPDPKHLEPVTQLENVRRGNATKRGTHCGNGHEYTEETTYWVRHCVTCHKASKKRMAERSKRSKS